MEPAGAGIAGRLRVLSAAVAHPNLQDSITSWTDKNGWIRWMPKTDSYGNGVGDGFSAEVATLMPFGYTIPGAVTDSWPKLPKNYTCYRCDGRVIMSEHKAVPMNVPGPFYVEDGCCLRCAVWETFAPNLMAWEEGDQSSCYFRKQPETSQEVYQALNVMAGAELDCIRYRGDEPSILRRMGEMGKAYLSDQQVPSDIYPVDRKHVTFSFSSSSQLLAVPVFEEIVRSFIQYCVADGPIPGGTEEHHLSFVADIVLDASSVTASCSWSSKYRYHITVTHGEENTSRVLVIVDSSHFLFLIDSWLRSSSNFNDLRWYTQDQWDSRSDDWQETPI